MQIAVTFRHMEADEGVKAYVKRRVQRLKKFIENPREAHVVLSVEKFRHSAELTIISDGLTLNSEGRDRDLYTAIDQMADRMDRRIRQRREKAKQKRGNPRAQGKNFRTGVGGNRGAVSLETSPMVKRKRIPAKPMSLEEAMAQLKLSGDQTLFFINSHSGQMNALQRRNGDYEWMEPFME